MPEIVLRFEDSQDGNKIPKGIFERRLIKYERKILY